MKNNYSYCVLVYVVALLCMFSTISSSYANEKLSADEALSEGTKEFLSDPARTGSLLGSIIAGAAVANPLAPLLGSVAGFMIGKSSAFSDKDSTAVRRQAYENRSLIPNKNVQILSLTGLTGGQLRASVQTSISTRSGESGSGNRSELIEPTIALGLPEHTDTGKRTATDTGKRRGNDFGENDQTVTLGLTEELQKKLANACSNVQLTQPISSNCYYYSQ